MNPEIALVSCLLTDTHAVGDVYGLSLDAFEDQQIALVYREIRNCYDRGEVADIVAIAGRIRESDIPRQRLMGIMREALGMSVPSVNARIYAGQIADRYKTRKLGAELSRLRLDPADIESQMSSLSGTIDKLREPEDGSRTMSDVVDEYRGEIFSPERQQGIDLGYPALDNLVQGMYGGNMVIIAARPSVGKSALAAEIMLNMAKSGVKVGFYSLEMSVKEIHERLAAHESGIELKRIRRSASAGREEIRCVEEAEDALRQLPVVLCDTLRTVSRIQNDIRQKSLGAAIIDYAQLIKPESRYAGNRTAEVGQISHSVKYAAKNLGIPIILLAQLNRISTSKSEPSMSELRESGDFEQDADKIIMMWNKSNDRRTKGVKVEKNRQGETGTVYMDFDGAVMSFAEHGSFRKAEEDDEIPFDA